MPTDSITGFLAEGWRRLLRRKALVAWLVAASLALGFCAFLLATSAVQPELANNLNADRLVHGFDLVTLSELMARPETRTGAAVAGSLLGVAVLGLVLLFCTPGICAEFLADRRLGTELFFQTCGRFFWRFVRLTILALAILLPTMAVLGGLRAALSNVAEDSENFRLPFYIFVATSAVMQFVGLLLRAWFDTAEFELIGGNRDSARRSLSAARRMTSGFRLQLLGIYLVPGILMWLATILLFMLWLRTPAESFHLTQLLLEATIFCWIVTRLWLRASMAAWYQAHVPLPVVELPLFPGDAVVEPSPDTPLVEADLP